VAPKGLVRKGGRERPARAAAEESMACVNFYLRLIS